MRPDGRGQEGGWNPAWMKSSIDGTPELDEGRLEGCLLNNCSDPAIVLTH